MHWSDIPPSYEQYCTYTQQYCSTYNIFSSIIVSGALPTESDCNCQVGKLPTIFQSTPVVEPGLFLNLDSPATCSGVISALLGCFYPQECTQNDTFVNFTVWRPDGGGSFHLATESNFVLSLSKPQLEDDYHFLCQSWQLPTNISVLVGDVLGVRSSSEGCHLLRKNIPDHKVYYLETEQNTTESLQLNENELTVVTGHGIYITASIG